MAKQVLLYQHPASPPCRAVKMVAHLVGLKLKLQDVDLLNGEQLKPQFLQINPFHKVPVIDDGGFILYEGNAIMRYLVNKYAPNSELYPQDPQRRAVVDQWLSLSSCSFFASAIRLVQAILFRGESPSEMDVIQSRECLTILNKKLAVGKFLTGEDITLADIAMTASLSEFVMGCFDFSDFPNVTSYMSRMRSRLSPAFAEINDEPEAKIKKLVEEAKSKLKS